MSTFEKIFEVFYCTAAIIWSCFLAVEVSTARNKMNWKDIVSLVFIINLTVFILAELHW